MIITRLLRAMGFMVYTEKELIEALTPPPPKPAPAQIQSVDIEQMIRSEK
jgi:hypothetical protein